MASEAAIMAVPGQLHIYTKVIGIACITSEIKFDVQVHRGYLGVTMAFEDTKMTVLR